MANSECIIYMKLSIYIYVTHLLGSGHLVRMRILADTLAARGHNVVLISGGMPLAEAGDSNAGAKYKFVQLPAVRVAANNFSDMLNADDQVADEEFMQKRCAQLLKVLKVTPQVLITETYPFGRRGLRNELNALIKKSRELKPRPIILSSVRDILQTRADKRMLESVDVMNNYFDGVLVHSDPAVLRLADSFAFYKKLNCEIFHTNYIYKDQKDAKKHYGDGEIIVSAGGGAVGFNLLKTAIEAKKILDSKPKLAEVSAEEISELADKPWRILIGCGAKHAQFDELHRYAADKAVVEFNREDFTARLQNCAVSISQAGYNTALDVALANCPSVLVPFDCYGETEQSARAAKWAQAGRAVVLAESKLDAGGLIAAVARARYLDMKATTPIKTNGADNSAKVIENYFVKK